MKRNMRNWIAQQISSPVKQPVPILSFPAIQLMGITVGELISSSDAQAQAMKLISDRTPSAASVSLMDLSVEAEAFGSRIRISDDEVPTVIGKLISSEEEAAALKIPEVGAGRTGLYVKAIEKAVQLISDRPVFAGVIGPFSLAGRLMDVSEAMVNCYEEPDMVHITMEKTAQFLISYCLEYKKAGADGVIMAEPLTGLLSPNLAAEFSAPYVKRIIDAVQDDEFIVVYHNCGNNTIQMVDSIISTGAAAYHFGNAIKMADMLPKLPPDVLVMGNVDPAREFRNGTPQSVKAATRLVMSECCGYNNFIVSSGCDIPPLTDFKNIDAFFEAVREFYS